MLFKSEVEVEPIIQNGNKDFTANRHKNSFLSEAVLIPGWFIETLQPSNFLSGCTFAP